MEGRLHFARPVRELVSLEATAVDRRPGKKGTVLMAMFRSSSPTLTLTALLTLLAVATGAVVLLAPTTADAEPAHGTHIKYYSSAARTTQVGYRYYTCEGVLESQWGVTSAYSTSATYGCIAEVE
jgi:hypothetical protein